MVARRAAPPGTRHGHYRHPMRTTVGPLPAEVYWRRRLLALGMLVVALVALRACTGGDTSRAGRSPQAQPTPSGAADGTASHPYLPGTSPSPVTSPLPTATPSASSGPAGSPGSAGSPSPNVSARPLAIGVCPDSALQLVAASDARSYQVGAKPKLTMTVRNVGRQACRRDLGPAARELSLRSGSAHTWSSADCQPGGAVAQLVLLKPGIAQTYALVWPGNRSQPKCTGPKAAATAGTYLLHARLGTLRSNGVVLTLN